MTSGTGASADLATEDRVTDVAILGAGPTGLALACALAGSVFDVTLIDAADSGRHHDDPRSLALSEGTRHILERLGAWPGRSTPIETIRISQQGGPGEALLAAAAERVPALGYVTAYRDLVAELLGRVHNFQKNGRAAAGPPQGGATPTGGVSEASGGLSLSAAGPSTDGANQTSITLRWNTRVVASSAADGPPVGRGRQLELSDGTTLFARLVVHAEGASDDGAFVADYDQCAIVCEATPETPHDRRAQERFTPDGPLALLPLGDAYSVVCVVPAAQRDALMALGNDAFADLLAGRMDGQMRFSAITPRAAFPLRLRLRKRLAEGREVWIGNAAQTLHPVSGQGFNLALRDAWTLADRLLQEESPATLRDRALVAWARERQLDRLGGAAFTDGIVRLFSNHLAPLSAARGAGLALLDRLPFAKSFVARRMIYGARAW